MNASNQKPTQPPLQPEARGLYPDALCETQKAWPDLSLYERFEEAVEVSLTGLIGLVIVAAVITTSAAT